MSDRLSHILFDAGLIQFGWFEQDGAVQPFHFSLDMLPSYPAALRAVRDAALPLMRDERIDYLLCTLDAVPLGVGLSLHTGVPLVYSRGGHLEPVHDLVGAYDIGHPALLVTHVLDDGEHARRLIAHARGVGLEVHTLLTILDVGIVRLDGITVKTLLRLDEVIAELIRRGDVPGGHVRTVLEWLDQHQPDR